ncbi:PLD nuclease N-terminal domain-containing protein [Arthrobacter sp. YAF17]|uniref:PLD nuclease N-terminal domain-containing protein n=1 Tax=Arthrobacter sp. YAF17 TaxID=3233077 RepID=UPI003F90BD8B
MVIVAGAIAAALFICALISIARSKNYTPAGRALWLLVVFALPALGPMLWFLRRASSPTGPAPS